MCENCKKQEFNNDLDKGFDISKEEFDRKFPNISLKTKGFNEIAKWFYYQGYELHQNQTIDIIRDKINKSVNYAL